MDPSTLQPFFDWLSSHPGWAGLIVFLIALTESLIIVGLVVPGTMAMLGVGALIGAGVLPFWSMAIWAVFGAIAGDAISYWVGYRYREHMRSFWPFNKKPDLLDKGEEFFTKHGGKSVLFGRFVGPVRPIVPAVAGMMEMSKVQFFTVNVFSAMAWAPVTLLPGVVLGASLSLAAAVAGRLAVFAVLLIVLLWLAVVVSRRLFRYFSPRAMQMVEATMGWAQRHRLLGPIVVAALDPEYPTAKGLLMLGIAVLLVLMPLMLLYVTFIGVGPSALDQSLQHYMQGLHTPFVDELMLYAHLLLQWPVLLVLSIDLILALLILRQFRLALYFTAACLLIGVTAVLANNLFGNQPAPFAVAPGLNPALMWSLIMLGLMASAVSVYLPPILRVLPYVLASIVAIFEMVALLYFAQAWFSELVVATLLALCWALVLGITMRRHMVVSRGMLIALSIALGSALVAAAWWGGNSWREQSLWQFSAEVEQRQIGHDSWAELLWDDLPAQRVDLRANERQQLVLQWSASRQQIKQVLSTEGWISPKKLDARSWLRWFSPDPDWKDVPLLPRIHDGEYEQFKFVRPDGNELLVMRFWLSHYRVEQQPLYLVSVTKESLLKPLGLMSVPRTMDVRVDVAELLAGWQGIRYRQQLDGRILVWQADK